MRMVKWNRGLRLGGAAAVGVMVLAGVASASTDVTTEQSGSILVWPKVVWDGTRDTIIQITNTGNPMVHAHCFYVNAAPSVDPCAPVSSQNPPQWAETDFDIWLTRQQPTHWVVSSGRATSLNDTIDTAGFDPGLVPPVPMCFKGELKCIETDETGGVATGNKLKGEATLRNRSGDVSKYNAIAFLGNPGLSSSDIGTDLQLDLTDSNPGGEFSACPDTLLVNHFAFGAPDLALAIGDTKIGVCTSTCVGGATPGAECTSHRDCGADSGGHGGTCQNNCGVNTTITLVPCQEDLENQIPGRVTVQFQIFNEFEQPFSASTTVGCWLDAPLNTLGTGPQTPTNNPFTFNVLGTVGAFTRIHPNPGNGGVIGVAEVTRQDSNTPSGAGATAAFNLNIEGNRFDGQEDGQGNPVPGSVTDHIILPGDSTVP
jgi:hypothetical protein